jgi:predicted DNA-binding transcriptional regulator AlpA
MTVLDHQELELKVNRPPTFQSKVCEDPLLTASQSAVELGISLPGFWNGVARGWLPHPIYVLPRAPRWRRSELYASVEKNRLRPAEAKLGRRNNRCSAT